jgi:hypothetical protein
MPIDAVLATHRRRGVEWNIPLLCTHTKEVAKLLANHNALHIPPQYNGRISRNKNMTMDVVLANPSGYWDWYDLVQNNNVTWEMLKGMDEPWKQQSVIVNANITWKIIKDNPDRPWYLDYLAGNPNITAKFVIEHPDIPWDFNQMSSNEFDKNPVVRKRLERLAAEEDQRISAMAEALEEVLPPVLKRIILEYVFM